MAFLWRKDMPDIYETTDYKVVLLSEEVREEKEANYGIMNKEFEVVEAMCAAQFMAFTLCDELQKNLDEAKPTPKANLTVLQ